jgi:hypothetical protein
VSGVPIAAIGWIKAEGLLHMANEVEIVIVLWELEKEAS